MDLELLRREIHAAVDETIDRALAGTLPRGAPAPEEAKIEAGEAFGDWTFDWPDKSPEVFQGRDFAVRANGQPLDVRLGWTTRRAWGRDRRRAVVFVRPASSRATGYYPATEFVETDTDRVAATIPDPSRPRSLLKDGDALPSRFDDAIVERADAVFRTIDEGPTLRLVLTAEDEVAMIRHGCWVAALRRRV